MPGIASTRLPYADYYYATIRVIGTVLAVPANYITLNLALKSGKVPILYAI